ncbi:uncharacterized protein EV420DRAFT_1653469 [Desarmillaria tabescens]|uniref:Chromo domain-containing protein n=1 Tax=Armillaria tabescens TaxID=1929756 RepID=A0AA39MIM7_ARMTA|nr:uncharacterized protein EV420DRAFT_1653469 [Desarmillaria tabescens]KAK0435094.1 hypothetical protein EV420DRAFT_1653469 [Desarmillaria tabescens]
MGEEGFRGSDVDIPSAFWMLADSYDIRTPGIIGLPFFCPCMGAALEMEDNEYHVEYLLAARADVDPYDRIVWKYLIKWTEYDEEEAMWEPRRSFPVRCRLLDSFWSVRRHREWASTYLFVVASREWIDAKRAWYWSQF